MKVGVVASSKKKNIFSCFASHLQKSAGVVLLDDLQAVLHQPRGLTQLHRTVRDLIPDDLEGKKT